MLMLPVCILGVATSPPGVVIDHLPPVEKRYVGSPALAAMPDGSYVATHDEFGPGSTEEVEGVTTVFRSSDRGATWKKAATLRGAFWSSLFVHRGRLYLLGTSKEYGNLVIRRSDDAGSTWTEPKDGSSGLLRDDREYHTAPVPVLVHAGRLWRGIERRDPPSGWGEHFQAGMMSAPVDADLLNARNWTLSNFIPSQRTWNGGDMGAWLEGNAVATPDGRVANLLRVHTASMNEKVAICSVEPDGKSIGFDPATGFVPFPGGAKKFTIRYDAASKHYWALASVAPSDPSKQEPGRFRNTLCLLRSRDLRNWENRVAILSHPDSAKVGFQYVDWLIDGSDLIAVCRTAFDDEQGGAPNCHDANFLTFHRIENFRKRTEPSARIVAARTYGCPQSVAAD